MTVAVVDAALVTPTELRTRVLVMGCSPVMTVVVVVVNVACSCV